MEDHLTAQEKKLIGTLHYWTVMLQHVEDRMKAWGESNRNDRTELKAIGVQLEKCEDQMEIAAGCLYLVNNSAGNRMVLQRTWEKATQQRLIYTLLLAIPLNDQKKTIN